MSTLWFTADRARRFLLPDDAKVAAGELVLRTSLGRERPVDEAAVLPYEVTAEEARAWSTAQLGAVLGEVRGKALGFVDELRARTAAMREENRTAWERGMADAPEEVRAAVEKMAEGLKDLGEAFKRAARADGASASPSPGASAVDETRAERETEEGSPEEPAPATWPVAPPEESTPRDEGGR